MRLSNEGVSLLALLCTLSSGVILFEVLLLIELSVHAFSGLRREKTSIREASQGRSRADGARTN